MAVIESCKHTLQPRKIIILVFSIFLPVLLIAQIDSSYIMPFKQELAIRPHVYYKFTSLTHEIDDNNEITYTPNSPVGIGLGIIYKNYSISAGYAFEFMRDKERGKTRSFDFQYHHYGRKFIFDLFFQNYKGLYTEDEKEDLYYHFPDIQIIQYGVYGQYVFNNKKFSYRAAFNQNERQLKSAGSFQLGGGLYYNQIKADSTLSLYGKSKLNNYQVSISGGYAYTWVIKRDYYVSGSIALGVNLGTQSLSNLRHMEISPSIFPRISMGYNADDWSIGLSAIVNRVYVTRTHSLKMLFDTGNFQFSYIKRFNTTPKFVKKIKYIN